MPATKTTEPPYITELMTHAAAHLLDSISSRISENRNLGNTASIQPGSLCVKCVLFEVLSHIWYKNNQKFDDLSGNNSFLWYTWQHFCYDRICTTMFWTLKRCMHIWPCDQTVFGLGAYGPQKCLNFFLPFTLRYGPPEHSMEPTRGRFCPTFLVEMRYPILPALWLAQALLRPPSGLSGTPFVPKQSGVDRNPMFKFQILSDFLATEVEFILDSTPISALVTLTLTI